MHPLSTDVIITIPSAYARCITGSCWHDTGDWVPPQGSHEPDPHVRSQHFIMDKCIHSIRVSSSLTHALTHWGRVTHICVSRLTITGSDNVLSPGRREAIIWTNAGILLNGPLGTNFRENWIEILTFPFTKMRLKVSSAKWRPFCLGLNMLNSTAFPPP